MSSNDDSIPEEPPLESPEILVSKVMQLHRSFKALLADHAIPILRQTEYVHTGAYALEALVNALSGTTLQVCALESFTIHYSSSQYLHFSLSSPLSISSLFKNNVLDQNTIKRDKNDDSACAKEEKTR